MPVFKEAADANPMPELFPADEDHPSICETDEQGIGIAYTDLDVMNILRGRNKLGPVSMFKFLLQKWKLVYSPSKIA
jgi:hypothetical protein